MKNIVVLVSGSGSNMVRLANAVAAGEIPDAHISLVVADRECAALQRAQNLGIATVMIPRGKDFSEKLAGAISGNVDLIVLAGFLSIIDKKFLENFNGKIINIHPSLLPKFGGKGMWGHHVHQAVLEAGEPESGATVHFVTPQIDGGAVIIQGEVSIAAGETPDSLAEKVLKIEHEILPKGVNLVLNKR